MDEAAPLNRYQLAELGSLLAEPARAAMLLVLVDGTARAGDSCANSLRSRRSRGQYAYILLTPGTLRRRFARLEDQNDVVGTQADRGTAHSAFAPL